MNQYKHQFKDMSSEYLLQRRALGEGLADEAHAAIEAIFSERGEKLPPKPTKPILLEEGSEAESASWRRGKGAGLLVVAVLVPAVAKQVAHTWLGLLVTLVCLGYFIYGRLYPGGHEGSSLTSPEALAERARALGLSEFTLAAAEGHVGRLRELIDYGHDVNAIEKTGSTALMYAARNGRVEAIRFLLEHGANRNAQAESGATALSFARKFGHKYAIAALEDSPFRGIDL